jgi:hypothetical protein
MGNHLRVRLGPKHHTIAFQTFPEDAVVFDDPVLNDGHTPVTTEVGVSIALLRFAMRGPAGVTDAALARGPLLIDTLTEIDQLAFGPQTSESTLSVNRCNTSGVIAPVLQLTQTLKQLRRCLL